MGTGAGWGGGREEVCAHADPPTRRLAMKTNRADSRNSVCSNKELIGKIVLLLARKVQMREVRRVRFCLPPFTIGRCPVQH